MGDDIGSGSVTDCCLRSFSDHRRHTQQCRAALRRKSKQTQPEPMSSPDLLGARRYHESANRNYGVRRLARR